MNLIHRHIFANVVLTCAAAVGLFAFVLMMGNALKDLLPLMLSGQLAWDTSLRLVGLLVPFVVSYALPMGMLTGILLVLGRMSAEGEITALRASGLSVAWLSAPILFAAILGVILCGLINFQFMPIARVAYHREMAAALQQNPLSFIVPKTFIRDFPGIVLYAGEKKGAALKDFWLWELDTHNRVKRFARADSGRLNFDEPHNKLVLTLERTQAEERDERDPENFTEARGAAAWDQATFDLPLDKVTGQRAFGIKDKWLTFNQLVEKWRQLKIIDTKLAPFERAQQRMQVQITMHEKFATAFSVLSFALIAIPLGIKASRKETSANLGIGLALTMAYYFATIVIGWCDSYLVLRPDLLIWLPTLSFQALGSWMLYKIDRA
ncbi:MAG: LptF/LptG family permease [Opitutaceae bacterium]